MILQLFKNDGAVAPLCITGERLYIRPPQRSDWKQWVEVRDRNHDFLKPWSPQATLSNITRDGYFQRLATYQSDWRDDKAYVFFVFRYDSDQLIGGVAVNNIVRGAGQMATIGYWMDERETKQGFMTEALLLACQFSFRALKLHRLQAGTLPENDASQKVLKNCGFQEEGIARKYIKIAGVWRDHQIFSLLREEFISLAEPVA